MSRILVIDSDLLALDSVRDARPDGTEVVQADNGDLALATLQAGNVAVVVLSADIPDGWALCRRLKKEAATAQVPLILTSALATKAQFHSHKQLPTRADAYLMKPFSDTELRHCLKRQLEKVQSAAPGPTASDAAPPAAPAAASPPPFVDLGLDDEFQLVSAPAARPASAPADPVVAAPRPPEPATAPTVSAAPPVAAAPDPVLTARVDELEVQNKKLRKAEGELKREIQNLTERLRNMKLAAKRVEEAQAMERNRMKGELEQAKLDAGPGASAGDTAALESELKRLRHLNADMLESLEIIHESLQVPIEIVERHREMVGATSSAPGQDLSGVRAMGGAIAMGGEVSDPDESKPAMALGSGPAEAELAS